MRYFVKYIDFWRPLLKFPRLALITGVLPVLFLEIFIKLVSGRWDFFYAADYPLIYNALLFISVILVATGIFRRPGFAVYVCVTPLSLLALVHGLKIRYLGEVFFVSDMKPAVVKSFLDVLPDLNLKGTILTLMIALILLAASGWRIFKHSRNLATGKQRLWCFAAGTFWLSLVLLSPQRLNAVVEAAFRIREWPYYRVNGYFVEGFLRSLGREIRRNVHADLPVPYSKSQVRKILANQASAKPKKIGGKPDLVVILAETFWDPLAFPELGVSPDPIPNIRTLMEKTQSGLLRVPLFGGGTAQTEFEALTGFSCHELDGYAYNILPNRPLPSIAAELARLGYEANSIHGYYGWFYNRAVAHRNLGFRRLYSKSDFESEYKISSRYVPDWAMARKILDMYNRRSPVFVFAVSSGGHGPFAPSPSAEKKYSLNPKIQGAARTLLLANLAALDDADAAFAGVISAILSSRKHTVFAVFGDHLPSNAFLPLFLEKNPANETKIFQTPYLIGDNRRLKRSRKNINAGQLPVEILETMGFGIPEYLRVLTRRSAPGNSSSTPAEARYLQYDLAFGEQYAWSK